MRNILCIFFLLTLPAFLLAQGEIDDQKKVFYRNESTVGLQLNSNGFGFDYRYGRRVDAFNKNIFEVGFTLLKHPKEIKYPYGTYDESKGFVYGKLNSFFELNGGYGVQNELFKKIDKGGVSIRYYYSLGANIGLLKPIYYLYFKTEKNIYNEEVLVINSSKFDESSFETPNMRDSFSKGFSETQIKPGAYAKFGLNFEYSTVDELVHALEIGFAIDGYLQKIEIMASQKPNHLFFTMFVGYRFGKIVDSNPVK